MSAYFQDIQQLRLYVRLGSGFCPLAFSYISELAMPGEDALQGNMHSNWFAQKLVEVSVDFLTVRDLMGHADIGTTQIYLGTTDDNKREAVQCLI